MSTPPEAEGLLRQCFESGQVSPAQAVAHGIKPITPDEIAQVLAGGAANDANPRCYTFTADGLERYVNDRIKAELSARGLT